MCVGVWECVLNRISHRNDFLGMQETHQGVPEEFIFGIVLSEEEFTVAAHGGLNLNHQLVVLQTSFCMRTQTDSVSPQRGYVFLKDVTGGKHRHLKISVNCFRAYSYVKNHLFNQKGILTI